VKYQKRGKSLARKLRVFVADTPVHIMIKSLDAIELFPQTSDVEFFKNILVELNQKLELQTHAYSLGQNYCEFLITPKGIDELPKFMQTLGRLYVTYFNKKYNRTGTLWQGRYKSSLVDSQEYLFDVMCFIEKQQNTICNSKEKNLYDQKDQVVTYHQLYKALGYTQLDRITQYQNIFANYDQKKDVFIQQCLEKQNITGSKRFIQNLEEQLGTVLSSKQRGRPKKSQQKENRKMYKNLQVLDKEKHKDLKLNPLENLNFAKQTPFIPVIIQEAALVGAAFPVVFTADENPALVSIVSLGGDSLAINNEGKWITQYVPSHLRKYPFTLAATENNPDQKMVLIDEDSTVFSNSKGKQLFKKSGEQSEVLEHAIKFLTTTEEQATVTKTIIEEITNSGILEDREISVGEGEEKKVLVNGFKVVDKEKLNNLSDDILASWVRRGIISFIDTHIKSLENINTLFNLASQRQN